MTNIIKLYNNKEFENSITEIRIEEVRDYDNNEFYYYIYCIKDTGQRIEVGRSKTNHNVINRYLFIIKLFY